MKLAIITERANITLGGAERSVFELAARMALLGVDVKILAAAGSAESRRVMVLCSGTETCPPGRKRVALKDFRESLLRHFDENHYDIIHSTLPFDFADVYQPRGGSYPEAAIRNAASYGTGALRIFKLLTSFANFKRAALTRAEKKLCELVRRSFLVLRSPYEGGSEGGKEKGPIVAALSEYVRTQFKKHYNLPDESIYVIPNGIRLPAPAKKLEADKFRTQILAKFNIKQADEPVFFLFAAHNFRLKGLANLIKALAVVKSKLTKRPAYLVVAGRGRTRKYRRLAARIAVLDRIIFLGPAGDIRNLLTICDIAVLPTYYDPSSRFILESLAAGKPVVTTKYNGAVDLFTADRHGKVFDSPDDINSLAEAMRYFCSTENIAAAKKAIEDDDIKSKVSIETHCRKLLELYKEIESRRTSNIQR